MRRPFTWVAERGSCYAIIRSERRITVVGADIDDTIMGGWRTCLLETST